MELCRIKFSSGARGSFSITKHLLTSLTIFTAKAVMLHYLMQGVDIYSF